MYLDSFLGHLLHNDWLQMVVKARKIEAFFLAKEIL
jgi:hypothetical protein